MERWPNFFIVGAPKAGTTSLYAYLKDIPGIYMSPVKEPKFFNESYINPGLPEKKRLDKKKYLSLFNGVEDEKFLGDASPSYLVDPKTPERIHNVSPDAKILISLRDPVERLFSSYLMLIRNGKYKRPFREEIENSIKNRPTWVDRGTYFERVKRFLDVFGSEQVKIFIFEEWIKNPKNTVREILQFLGINYEIDHIIEDVYNPFSVSRGSAATSILSSAKIKRFGEKFFSPSTRRILRDKILTIKPEKPKMEKKDRDFLIDFYKDDVKKLENFLGRKLPWKNFSSMITESE